MRVLLVEDDEMIGSSLQQALGRAGWTVDWVRDGEPARAALGDGGYTCVLLDLGLPRLDGLSLLRQLRARGELTPVLVLTARDGVDERILGLDLGADDYLAKPFELGELLARMRALLRRRSGAAQSLLGAQAVLQLDLNSREALREGRREPLTARGVRAPARAARTPRQHPLARAAGAAHLRLGRGGLQQCRRCADPRHAAQARRGRDPQCARPGLARAAARDPMSPRSLRGQLVLWLLPLHLLTTAIVGGVFYVSYGAIVHGFMDGQMRALAQSYASRDCADLRAPPPLAGWEVHEAGNFVVQLWCGGDALAPVPVGPALQPRPGWIDDGTWRVYSMPAPAGSRMPDVQVLQSEAFRREEVGGRALFASLSGLLLLPVALGVMVLVVGRASCRLRDSARQLAQRDEHSGAPLAQTVPSEIAPLVQSFEGLLARLREALGAQRRFVQDAAHELRTPLTALSLQLENLRPHLTKAGPEFRAAAARHAPRQPSGRADAAPVAPGCIRRRRARGAGPAHVAARQRRPGPAAGRPTRRRDRLERRHRRPAAAAGPRG